MHWEKKESEKIAKAAAAAAAPAPATAAPAAAAAPVAGPVVHGLNPFRHSRRAERADAFAEAQSDGMRHLRALAAAGVTDVHLLLVFDFTTVPYDGAARPDVPADAPPDSERQQAAVAATAARDAFNWGYDPWHFSAPEGSYASDAADGST